MPLVCNKDTFKIQRPFVFPEVRRITQGRAEEDFQLVDDASWS